MAKGQQVLAIAGCGSCHTAKGGALLAGGDPIRTPFGVFHAPNITPDAKTGIGDWSAADLARALHEGRGPDGTVFYPSFPYTSYTGMTDEDVGALWAYLRSVPPVERAPPPHELSFPYSVRPGLRLWQWWSFEPRRFEPDPQRGADWNRGAYIVNALAHCQECHTPRSWTGARDEARAFAGADLGKGIGKAPPLTSGPKALGGWADADLLSVFQLGALPDGDFVSGPMAEVVEHGTSKLPSTDQQAIVTYLRSLPPG